MKKTQQRQQKPFQKPFLECLLIRGLVAHTSPQRNKKNEEQNKVLAQNAKNLVF